MDDRLLAAYEQEIKVLMEHNQNTLNYIETLKEQIGRNNHRIHEVQVRINRALEERNGR